LADTRTSGWRRFVEVGCNIALDDGAVARVVIVNRRAIGERRLHIGDIALGGGNIIFDAGDGGFLRAA
jgi:hypothetical protein